MPLRAAIAIAVLFAAALLSGACVSPSAEPGFHVSGVVVDARTGNGIAGALVADRRWGAKDPRGAVSSPDGSFGYFTWYEEHEIVASADGYRPASSVLDTYLVGRSPVMILEFRLEPLEEADSSLD